MAQASRTTPRMETFLRVRKLCSRSTEITGTPSKRVVPHLTPRSEKILYKDTPRSSRKEKHVPSVESTESLSRLSPCSSRDRRTFSSTSSPNMLTPGTISPSLLQRRGSPSKYRGDRYIPNRSRMDLGRSNFALLNKSPCRGTTPTFISPIPSIRILNFGNGSSPRDESIRETASTIGKCKPFCLKEDKSPVMVLDAPGVLVQFDYPPIYALDWSCKSVVALALNNLVYLWESETCKTTRICESSSEAFITAVKWNQDGSLLAVASSDGKVNCWFRDTNEVVVLPRGNQTYALEWKNNTLMCGEMHGYIRLIDVNNFQDKPPTRVRAHDVFPVVILAWNHKSGLLASGSEEEGIRIWTSLDSKPLAFLETTVTNIACRWCPWMNSVLAVGNGFGMLSVWRISESPTLLSDISREEDTVTDIQWFPPTQGLFSSHFNGEINYWTFPLLRRTKTFKGHQGIVLRITVSPDFRKLMSVGEDECIRVWNVSQSDKNNISTPTSLNKLYVR